MSLMVPHPSRPSSLVRCSCLTEMSRRKGNQEFPGCVLIACRMCDSTWPETSS